MNKVQPVKGTRDFYPEQMAFRNWFYGKIKKISQKYGYEEFDGPEIEYLELYSEKTSEEILKEQAFSLKDRDNRTILLRPEITPTFARMVAQKSQQLPKPIRWYSFGRAWRYEQPQKGREREFFQWEINLLGPENPEADAEILAIAVDFFKELDLTPNEVVIKVNDRSYFENVLKENVISQDLYMPILRIIDRIEKISKDEFNSGLKELKLNDQQISALEKYLNNTDYSESEWLQKVFESLKNYPNSLDYIVFDPRIARGFEYYTRTVFEAWDKTNSLKRALFGGGRFDNLTATLGGERIPGVGMAPGDVPMEVILRQFNKMPDIKPINAKVLVTIFDENLYNNSLKTAVNLREKGIDTELWMDSNSKLEKQLKYADQKQIPFVVIIGSEEAEKNMVTLKDMKTREQKAVTVEEVIEEFK